MKKLTTEEFIINARKTHGDKYDYSNSIYKNSTTKIEIICSSHGSFWQTPSLHIYKNGCSKCGDINRKNKTIERNKQGTTPQEQYIEKAKLIHKNEFDYSKTIYKGVRDRVTITCKVHGDFSLIASAHISNGHGCPTCAKISWATIDNFENRAREIHGNKYDYSMVDFMNKDDGRVTIICPQHGPFKQQPSVHIGKYKNGCRICAINSKSRVSEEWLDHLAVPHTLREITVQVGDKKIRADAYDPETNTIYEFWGDYWHGNPKKFPAYQMNKSAKKLHGELYQKTIEKIELIKTNGFNLVDIWESEWRTR